MRTKARNFGLACVLIMAVLGASIAGTRVDAVGAASAAVQAEQALQTRIVVLHADWSLGPVDVYLNNDEVLTQFGYGQVSDWIDIEPGSVRVTITTNQGGLNFNYVAFDSVYPMPAGKDYSLIVTTPLLLSGAFDTSPIPDGGARVRIVHGAVSVDAVDVTADEGGAELAENLRYSAVSDHTVVPAGTYEVTVSLSRSGEAILRVPDLVLAENTTYELVIMGQPGDNGHPLELRALADTVQE